MGERLSDFVLAWLETKGPAEWHGVAKAWNWDSGVEPLLWILDQPDCDLSTGLEIFWLGESFGQLDCNNSEYGSDRDHALVARKAIERVPQLSGGRFRFRPPDYALSWIDKGLHWDAATVEALQPFLVEIAADDRYPMYDEGVPAEARIAWLVSLGEPIDDWLKDSLNAELAAENMSATEAEQRQKAIADRKADIREWAEIFEEVERIKGE